MTEFGDFRISDAMVADVRSAAADLHLVTRVFRVSDKLRDFGQISDANAHRYLGIKEFASTEVACAPEDGADFDPDSLMERLDHLMARLGEGAVSSDVYQAQSSRYYSASSLILPSAVFRRDEGSVSVPSSLMTIRGEEWHIPEVERKVTASAKVVMAPTKEVLDEDSVQHGTLYTHLIHNGKHRQAFRAAERRTNQVGPLQRVRRTLT